MTTDAPPPYFTPRRFGLVLALGLIASSGAFWLSMQRHLPRDPNFGAIVLPGLAGRLPDVDQIRLANGAAIAVTLVRRNGHFVVVERAGFAADAARVRTLLTALADLKVAERHHVARESWASLGLEPGTRIDLTGRLPATTLTLGRAVGPESIYLRIGDADEVLEAGPAPALDLRPTDWLRHTLVDIAPREIRRIEYALPGATLVLERPAPDAPFAWQGAHAGSAMPAALAQAQPTLLTALDVQDVRAASPWPAMLHTAVETYAGLRVECEGHIEHDRHWLRLTARYVPGAGIAAPDAQRARDTSDRLNALTSGFDVELAPSRFAELFINAAAAPEPIA